MSNLWLLKEAGLPDSVLPKGRVDSENLPGLTGEKARHVLAELSAETNKARDFAEELDQECVRATLHDLTTEANADLLSQGLPVLPHRNSVGWNYSVAKRLQLFPQTVGNTEDREVDPDAEADFKEYFVKLANSTEACSISHFILFYMCLWI